MVSKIKKQSFRRGRRITRKDLALFTRQLSTMLKAGVPLMQSFDIVGRGHANPSMARLMNDIKMDVETGTSLNQAFRKYPLYFDPLFCNLVAAGEQAGILETLLDRLAMYQEKTIALQGKIKKAMFYPVSIIMVAILVTAVIMIFVIPSFKNVFTSFGADMPATLVAIAMSDFFVRYWYIVFGCSSAAFISSCRRGGHPKYRQSSQDAARCRWGSCRKRQSLAGAERWQRRSRPAFPWSGARLGGTCGG
jgi:type IV pilus assembly protein PilC